MREYIEPGHRDLYGRCEELFAGYAHLVTSAPDSGAYAQLSMVSPDGKTTFKLVYGIDDDPSIRDYGIFPAGKYPGYGSFVSPDGTFTRHGEVHPEQARLILGTYTPSSAGYRIVVRRPPQGAGPVTGDGEHAIDVTADAVASFREWLDRPNGSITLAPRMTVDAVQGGGITVRTCPYGDMFVSGLPSLQAARPGRRKRAVPALAGGSGRTAGRDRGNDRYCQCLRRRAEERPADVPDPGHGYRACPLGRREPGFRGPVRGPSRPGRPGNQGSRRGSSGHFAWQGGRGGGAGFF